MQVALLAALQLAQLVDNVRCPKTPACSYAVYVPSSYKASQPWPLLLAFDPEANGRIPVELFAVAAEKHGWIIAASNNARNADQKATAQALREISEDLFQRYSIHSKRIYLAAASFHAPVVNDFAVATPGTFAGVILAGAAFPGARVPRSVRHPIYAAVGLDDGTWTRLQKLDAEMKSTHRVMTFEKRATWMPTEFATRAVEWHELQAMRSGLRAKNTALIARLFDERAAEAQKLVGKPLWEAVRNIAEDFEGLDTRASAFRERAQALLEDAAVQQDFKRERIEQTRQRIAWSNFLQSHSVLESNERRPKSLAELEFQISNLQRESKQGTTPSDRLVASRTLDAILSRFRASPTQDPDFAKILQKLGLQ